MKKILFAYMLLGSIMVLPAQTRLYKTSWAPDGGSASQGNTQIIYTTGEIFVAEANNGTNHLSEGFIGPDLTAFLQVESYTPLPGLRVFPNPVRDFVQIRLQDSAVYEVKLFDLTGKLILERQFEGNTFQLDMRPYRSGFYILSVIDRKNERFSSLKIEKK